MRGVYYCTVSKKQKEKNKNIGKATEAEGTGAWTPWPPSLKPPVKLKKYKIQIRIYVCARIRI